MAHRQNLKLKNLNIHNLYNCQIKREKKRAQRGFIKCLMPKITRESFCVQPTKYEKAFL